MMANAEWNRKNHVAKQIASERKWLARSQAWVDALNEAREDAASAVAAILSAGEWRWLSAAIARYDAIAGKLTEARGQEWSHHAELIRLYEEMRA